MQEIVIGMPHRGRLNVLANVVRKPMAQIFTEFSGKARKGAENEYMGSGDVKVCVRARVCVCLCVRVCVNVCAHACVCV